MAFDAALLQQAYESCFRNRDSVLVSRYCGCIDCLATMDSSVVTTFVGDAAESTALCPSCGMDTVLPDASGIPPELPLLKALHLQFLNDPEFPDSEPWPRCADSSPGGLARSGTAGPRRYKSSSEARGLLVLLRANAIVLARADFTYAAAVSLLHGLEPFGLELDADFVRLGSLLCHAGLVLHPSELSGTGSLHETAGERLLLANNAEPDLARVCVTHSRWSGMAVSPEELLVALASHLWRGLRDTSLEHAVAKRLAESAETERDTLRRRLAPLFTAVATGGKARLEEANRVQAPAV